MGGMSGIRDKIVSDVTNWIQIHYLEDLAVLFTAATKE